MPTGGRTPSHSRSRLELVAILGILAFGAILRTVQYAARGSLWLDELAIAVNVVGRVVGDARAFTRVRAGARVTIEGV